MQYTDRFWSCCKEELLNKRIVVMYMQYAYKANSRKRATMKSKLNQCTILKHHKSLAFGMSHSL